MEDFDTILSGLILELRRGVIVLSVLSQLSQPKYGYSLVQSLEKKKVSVEPNTLYPLLRRLEKQEILKSEWETSSAKPRKYYVLTDFGVSVYRELHKQWLEMNESMNQLFEGGNEDGNEQYE